MRKTFDRLRILNCSADFQQCLEVARRAGRRQHRFELLGMEIHRLLAEQPRGGADDGSPTRPPCLPGGPGAPWEKRNPRPRGEIKWSGMIDPSSAPPRGC